MTSEEQQLSAIESQLRRSDPGLDEMFAVFSSQPTLRQGPVRERLTPWRPAGRPGARAAAGKLALLVAVACLLAACVAVAVAVGGHQKGPAPGTRPVPATRPVNSSRR